MHSSTARYPQVPGPLNPWVQHAMHEAGPYVQRGREAITPSVNELERLLEENATAVTVAGIVLGTFVDRRFYLLPLALGGLKLWQSLQKQ